MSVNVHEMEETKLSNDRVQINDLTADAKWGDDQCKIHTIHSS